MSARDADCVIVGAGCAGLSLAVALVESGYANTHKVVLLDSRKEYSRDRNWCFFDVKDHPFRDAIAHRFPRFRVRHRGRELLRDARGNDYVHVPADRFYEIARARFANTSVELHLGSEVSAINDAPSATHASVESSLGALRARHVFDSRPVKTVSDPAHVHLLQHFIGLEIECERAIFDPSIATLMDFDVTQKHGIHFVYVLPFSRTRALIESTFFSDSLLDEAIYEQAIERYVRERYSNAAYRIVDRERGVIPMTTQPFETQPSSHVQRIGLAGGFAKPSTGYAFLSAQRYAQAAAHLLSRGLPLSSLELRKKRSIFLDSVFLAHLRKHPQKAPELFFRLFERAPTDVLVRFLSEQSSALDDARVMKSLPPLALMLTAAASSKTWRASL